MVNCHQVDRFKVLVKGELNGPQFVMAYLHSQILITFLVLGSWGGDLNPTPYSV